MTTVLVGTGIGPDALAEELSDLGYHAVGSEERDVAIVTVASLDEMRRLFSTVNDMAGCVWPLDISEADLAEGDSGFELDDPSAAWPRCGNEGRGQRG